MPSISLSEIMKETLSTIIRFPYDLETFFTSTAYISDPFGLFKDEKELRGFNFIREPPSSYLIFYTFQVIFSLAE